MVPSQINSDESSLSAEERQYLLLLARQSLENAVMGNPPPIIPTEALTNNLRQLGASFVTLTIRGMLRGCIGALEPYQCLADDVREHAASAALDDYRFHPVQPQELPDIHIEISRLTIPKPLEYKDASDLVSKLQPGVHGVVLRDGFRRATFLPQVWEKIPSVEDFLAHLCMKMGAAPDLWERKKLEVLVYKVEEFAETD